MILVFLGTIFSSLTVFAAPWDFLRVPTEAATTINPIIMWIAWIISLGVLVVSLLALKKKSTQKLLFVSAAFALFFIKITLGLVDLYASPGIFMNFAVQGVFDLLIILSLFIALFRK